MGVCIQVPIVLGTGSTQHLICTEIPLKPAAFEIKEIQKKVVVTSCCVGGVVCEPGGIVFKVIIDAVLKKNINFKSVNDGGKKDDDDSLQTRLVCGDVRHCHVEIPFCTLIEVPFTFPDSTAAQRVQAAHATSDLANLFTCKVKSASVVAQCTEEIRDDDKDGCIERLIEKDVVRIEVKVEFTDEIEVEARFCRSDKC